MDRQLQSAFAAGYERLSAWADLLDLINVFPVADADTGSNLRISLAPLHRLDGGTDVTVKRLLASASGNSGNIACGFFTAFIVENPSKDFFMAAKAGRDRAWQAVADPKPGTMLTVFDELSAHFDRIVIDSPPVHPVADAAILTARVDTTVFVVRSNRTVREMARRGVRALRELGAHISGVVVNALPADRKGYYYSYYYSRGYKYGDDTAT